MTSMIVAIVTAGWLFGIGGSWATPPPVASPDPPDPARTAPRKVLTVERIYAPDPIAGRSPSSIRWMNDSRGISFLQRVAGAEEQETHLIVAAIPSGKRHTLCVIDTIAVPADLSQNEDDKFKVRSYRWAKKGDLGVFRFKNDIFTLSASTGEVVRRTTSEESEANVAFSHDGKKIAFTRGHDMWMIDIENNQETQLTTDGSDSLLNGVLDWVYMEELFTRGNVKGYWWSPDSKKIAYLQIDESPVEVFPIVDFVPTYNTTNDQHYPKAGSNNPIVRVGVIDLERGGSTWMDIDTSDDSYIARLSWLGDSRRLAVEKLNRNQDELQLLFADIATGDVQEILREAKETWVNVTYMKHFYETRDRFVWNSERDGNSHLYLYKNDGSLLNTITQGPWGVTELNDVSERRGTVYFTALEASVLERHIYRVGEKGGKIRRLSKRPGTHSAIFSPDHRYYIDRFSNVTTPSVVSVHDANGHEILKIHDPDRSELDEYDLPVTEFITITSKAGLDFNCSLVKPTDFDPTQKYPVLVYVYGGPHAQIVRNRWAGSRGLWHAYMAKRGYIVFSLDNRGSFGRGPAWEDPVLEHMGRHELEDQLTGVEYLKSLPYVDGSRIGIWGWSYGGYMTSMAMFRAPGVYAAGAAVAPVTDWRFYDTIYTERYMKRPQDNEDGYDDSAPIHFADGLQSPFLLIHGTSDDNVHMANSMRLVSELIEAGKDFDFMVYPRKLHGISGQSARVHLYRRLTKFFDRHLMSTEGVTDYP